MTRCQWCGDNHDVDKLCQKAQTGMTRRSFCFLFGAGIVGAALGGEAITGILRRGEAAFEINYSPNGGDLGRGPIPPGAYNVVLSDVSITRTLKPGGTNFLKLDLRVKDGPYAGRSVPM